MSRKGLAKIGSAKVFMAEHAQINANCLLLSARDIHIGKNSTLAYGVTVLTAANPNAPYNDMCQIYPPYMLKYTLETMCGSELVA